jgi:ribosomal peptide maturation radical SAM protein 1
MVRQRACLVSLPWDYYQSPSIAIGGLASYARKRCYEVDARHLHLETAALFDLSSYAVISHRYPVFGEAICAALVLPDQRRQFLEFAATDIADAEDCCDRIGDCLRTTYESYDWSSFQVVGFTIHFAQLFSSLLFASWIKRDNPDIRIVLGGGCITESLGTSILEQYPHVDYCVHGDGEVALVGLLAGLEDGRGEFESGVPGLIHRAGPEVRCNPRSCLSSLRGLPDPDYDHYFQILERDSDLGGGAISPYMPVELSRGCRHRCAFCNFTFENPYRPRPSSQVAASIRRLVQRYRTNSISLMALMIPPDQADRLFKLLISHHIDYRFFCEARAGLTKSQLETMKKAGVTEVQIGIEALNSSLLAKMNKGTRLIDNLQIMKFCEEVGIKSYSFMILGFPTETQKEIDQSAESVDYVCGYEPMREVVPFTMRGGSPASFAPEKYGISWQKTVGLFSDVTYLPHQWRTEFTPRQLDRVDGVDHWFMDFREFNEARDYDPISKRIERWRVSYQQARQAGHPLLFYQDCGEFLIIEDFRHIAADGRTSGKPERRLSLILDGWQRDLYLWCDSIRPFQDIVERFPDRAPRGIQTFLGRLVKHKLMFREGDEYLSLAISGGSRTRRSVPFPWV